MSSDARYNLVVDTELNDSSELSTTGNNVSFIDITYTIQPWSLFTRFPPKRILDHVRYVC